MHQICTAMPPGPDRAATGKPHAWPPRRREPAQETTTHRPPAHIHPSQSRFARAATKMSSRRIRNAHRASGTCILTPELFYFAQKHFYFARHLNVQIPAVPDEAREPTFVDTVWSKTSSLRNMRKSMVSCVFLQINCVFLQINGTKKMCRFHITGSKNQVYKQKLYINSSPNCHLI